MSPIFMKLKNSKERYVHIPYTKFYPNQTINMESMDIKVLYAHKCGFHSMDFHETYNCATHLVDIFMTLKT